MKRDTWAIILVFLALGLIFWISVAWWSEPDTARVMHSSRAPAMTQDDLMHVSAHAGVSYALDTGFYGLGEKWVGMTPLESEIAAATTTLMIGLAYKGFQGQDFPSDTPRALVSNAAGVGGAILTHVTFHF